MKINDDVANVLANSTVEKDKLFLPQGQLERKLYTSANKVLVTIGGKWNRKAKAHLFGKDVESIIEEILFTGEYTDSKKEYQFFETPVKLAKELVDLADIQPWEKVLEPSAGKARIASLIDGCHCVELNPENRKYLMENNFELVGENFLDLTEEYDVIVANPPFTKQQDIDHINHMIKLSRRRVVSVASSSILFRDNKKTVDFRNKIKGMGGTIMPLPEKTFSKSGTNVNTCIVYVDI